METRQIEQVRIYKLYLKDMRGKLGTDIVAISYKKESLINWYKGLLADQPYMEEKDPNTKSEILEVSNLKVSKPELTAEEESIYFNKLFKKGSPLEWYAEPIDPLIMTPDGIGINDSWTTQEHIESYIKQQNGTVLMIEE